MFVPANPDLRHEGTVMLGNSSKWSRSIHLYSADLPLEPCCNPERSMKYFKF
jgi:hypothetical protein